MDIDGLLPGWKVGRALLPLGLVSFAVGVATAVVVPFLSLFLTSAVRADPIRVTVFLVAAPLAGVVASTAIARVSDRRPIRRRLLIVASVSGVVSAGLTAVVRDYWLLLGLTVSAAALSAALLPQTFAYARQVLDRGDANLAAVGVSVLRALFSVAWVVGPPVAAVLLAAGGFGYLYALAAALYGVAALVAIFWLDEVRGRAGPGGGGEGPGGGAGGVGPGGGAGPDLAAGAIPAPGWQVALAVVGFTVLQCPLTLGLQALPLLMGAELGGDVRGAGVLLGLCAALEIPLMIGLGVVAGRLTVRVVVLVGACCGAAYNLVAALAPTVWTLAAAQLLNAAFIAAVAGLGISFMQDMLPGQPGRAATLFINSYTVGSILAGPLLGVSQHVGYRFAYVAGAGLCVAGLLLLISIRRPANRAT
nr:MFS transporter [Micromonospora sp. DSM 115978]